MIYVIWPLCKAPWKRLRPLEKDPTEDPKAAEDAEASACFLDSLTGDQDLEVVGA